MRTIVSSLRRHTLFSCFAICIIFFRKRRTMAEMKFPQLFRGPFQLVAALGGAKLNLYIRHSSRNCNKFLLSPDPGPAVISMQIKHLFISTQCDSDYYFTRRLFKFRYYYCTAGVIIIIFLLRWYSKHLIEDLAAGVYLNRFSFADSSADTLLKFPIKSGRNLCARVFFYFARLISPDPSGSELLDEKNAISRSGDDSAFVRP